MNLKVIFAEDDPELAGIVNPFVEGSLMFTKNGPILFISRENYPKLRQWAEFCAANPDEAYSLKGGKPVAYLTQIDAGKELELAGDTNGR